MAYQAVRNAFVSVVITLTLSGCSFVAARRGLNEMNAGNCKAAVDIMLPAAKAGYGNSLNNLGVIWEHGCPEAGMEVDYSKAYGNFLLAAKTGLPIAFSNAAMLAEGGFPGSPPDIDTAVKLYAMGARYGDPASISALSRLGRPVPIADLKEQALKARHEKQMEIALLAAGVAAASDGVLSAPAVPIPAPTVPVATPDYSVRAFWTGRQERVTTVTYKAAWNCEFNYNGQTFWRIFENVCPSSIQVQ
ncbi:MAG TPA: hypothetical protein VIL60_10690 [Rhodanobacter sp.]